MDLRMFDSLESTNKYCELLDLTTVGEFAVICAKEQTAGIGQRGNCWHSEAGKNLTFSIVLKPTFLAFENQYALTKAVSLGIVDALEGLISKEEEISIKWPNDIYIGRRKVCGVLISNRVSGGNLAASIVGVGLNVNQTEFPDWIPNPVSIKQLTGNDLPLDMVLEKVVGCIEMRYKQLEASQKEGGESMDADYLSRLLYLGVERTYLCRGSEVRATIKGVNRFGHLELVTKKGEGLTCQLKELVFL